MSERVTEREPPRPPTPATTLVPAATSVAPTPDPTLAAAATSQAPSPDPISSAEQRSPAAAIAAADLDFDGSDDEELLDWGDAEEAEESDVEMPSIQESDPLASSAQISTSSSALWGSEMATPSPTV